MFKHILIPTDGSKLPAALRAGMQLAKEQDSQVTVLYVMPDYAALMYSGEAMMTYNTSDLNKDAERTADRCCRRCRTLPGPRGCTARLREP
jgi:hypothetical protein